MSKLLKFAIGVILAFVAYGIVRLVAPTFGAGQLLSSMIGGFAAVLVFFAAGKPLGYVGFRKK